MSVPRGFLQLRQDTASGPLPGHEGCSRLCHALVATGGTASGSAFKTAYQKVTALTEDSAQAARNGQVPTKYIVFMTDGENNYANDDTVTKQWCDTAKASKVQIYSVAFMAPDRGQKLLKLLRLVLLALFEADEASDLVAAFKRDRRTRLCTGFPLTK